MALAALLASLAVQAGRVALAPFMDDGATMTHELDPISYPMATRGGSLTTVLRVGAKEFRVWVTGERLEVEVGGVRRPVPWDRQAGTLPDSSAVTGYDGEMTLPIADGRFVRYRLRLLVSASQSREFRAVREHLLVVPEFGYEGAASLGGRPLRFVIRGGDAAHARLFIDRDGDGVFGSKPQELYDAARPFALGGRTYRISAFDPIAKTVRFAPSAEKVAEVAMPPDLRVGRIAPSFRVAGVAFPGDFRGKLVLLDAWATWCPNCITQISYLKQVYAQHRLRGFEVASVNVDDAADRRKAVALAEAKGETWRQGFSAGGWKSPFARRYGIDALPFLLLVNGSTGRILATTDELYGDRMVDTVGRAMVSRGIGSDRRSARP